MKSNYQASVVSATVAIVPEYETLHQPDWPHKWNVSKSASNDHSATRRLISDYYYKEANTITTAPTAVINRAYPRHHAIIMASIGSSTMLISHECTATKVTRARAYARVHDPCHSTALTEITSSYQKHHITSLSAMTGLLVRRLLMKPEINSIKTRKKYAKTMNQYIHSVLASEYIIGNHYYRNLKSYITDTKPIGFLSSDATRNLITSNAIQLTQDELCETYHANIGRLMSMIQRFKRGLVDARQIREDPEFVRMMTLFWRLLNQLIKYNNVYNSQEAPHNSMSIPEIMCYTERKDAKCVVVMSFISEPFVLTPLLYQSDVVDLFDSQHQSYAKLVKTSKKTLIRLANDGSTASFLAFASIEPMLVTKEYAPKIGEEYHDLSLKSCANFIPSKHPVFGNLRVKHQCHIMRTADALPNGVERENIYNRSQQTYVPLYDKIEEIKKRDYKIEIKYTPKHICKNNGVSLFERISNDNNK